MWVDSGNGIYFQMWTKQKKEQKCWRVQWQNWEGRHLKSCQMMRSVFFAFLFGLAVMASWWKENDLEGPILLANRDNDPVIQERNTAITEGDTPTPAQERAFEQSTHSAIKMAQIAGSIFNHKDDKKGHHDLFRYWWWEHVGTPFTFPDTSNNRFQSYCDAAGALLLYSDQFMEFLENLRINKQNSRLNHMEQNLWNALKCNSTTTELAVLAIYAEAISYPYMKAIRASSDKNQNMLDLGPLHHSVYNHMQKIIADPDILLNKEASHMTAILNGEEWQNLDVVEKIHDCASSLPHLKDLLVAFFKGAAETWKRFISEFAPGGLIDEATTEERGWHGCLLQMMKMKVHLDHLGA